MKERNKKGFTLIELLAVIVILAIIALIATPIVMNLISKARKSAAEDSAYGIIKAAETHYAESLLDELSFGGATFTCAANEGTKACTYSITDKDGNKKTIELTFNGTKPTSGTITITTDGKVEIKDLVINNYKCNYKENTTEVECISSTETKTTTTTKITYQTYNDGDAVYYNPTTGSKCSASQAVSTTGTKSGCMKFYAFNDLGEDSSEINLILDHNTTAIVAWNSANSNTEMKEVKTALANDTNGWVVSKQYDGLNARLIKADEVAEITGAKEALNWDYKTSTSPFYFDGTKGSDTTWQTQVATSRGESDYAWLYDNTYGCTSYGCDVEDNNKYAYETLGITSSLVGYWTSTPIAGSSNNVWLVFKTGSLSSLHASSLYNYYYGVRPVITVLKSDINEEK